MKFTVAVVASVIALADSACLDLSTSSFCSGFKAMVPIYPAGTTVAELDASLSKVFATDPNMCGGKLDISQVAGLKTFICARNAMGLVQGATLANTYPTGNMTVDVSCVSPASAYTLCKSSCTNVLGSAMNLINANCNTTEKAMYSSALNATYICSMDPDTNCITAAAGSVQASVAMLMTAAVAAFAYVL